MNANYPDRDFQLWEFTVSHGSLLIRSPRNSQHDFNIDLIFVGVELIALPRLMRGLSLSEGTPEDVARMEQTLGSKFFEDRVFVFTSEGRRHHLVAANCRIDQNQAEIFDSPFDFQHKFAQK